ncbi:MAG: hypothetical protein U1E37_11790 [Sphingomonadaceae bacterium]
MTDTSAPVISADAVATVLRGDLAHGDAQIGTIAPILRHLLANDQHSLFADEIVACVRGMCGDVARQLLDRLAVAAGGKEGQEHRPERIEALVDSLVAHSGFLGHVHALALEWQLTERLQARQALDPVLSPLLEALISSSDPAVAADGMALLAAQARWVQAQRRMQLPLTELPGDLLHAAILAMRGQACSDDEGQAAANAAERSIRESYDEARTRLGIAAGLLAGMGGGAAAALSVSHAGVALFISALALASGQDRDMAVLATGEGQQARLALTLRAAGLKQAKVEEQFVSLHPEAALPQGFEQLGADTAAALLARSAPYPGC